MTLSTLYGCICITVLFNVCGSAGNHHEGIRFGDITHINIDHVLTNDTNYHSMESTVSNNLVQINETENCSIVIDEDTAGNFITAVETGYEFAFLRMLFRPNITVATNESKFMLYPYIWSWTHTGINGLFPVLEYPYDFGLVSMGFLKKYVNYNVTLIMNIVPANCSTKLALGQNETNELIFQTYKALGERLRTNGSNIFCYTVHEDVYNTNRVYYYISHFFGQSEGYLYRMCDMEELGGMMKVRETTFIWVLKVWAWLSFLFCPLLLNVFESEGAEVLSLNKDQYPRHVQTHGYREIEGINYVSQFDDIDRDEQKWLFKGDTPVSLCNILRYFICFKGNGPIVDRIRRFLLIILSPFILYIIIIVYKNMQYRSLFPRLHADIPIGFPALFYGFSASLKSWEYFYGGPYIMYAVYFIATISAFCIPRSLRNFLTKRLQGNETADCIDSFFGLNGQNIEKFSGIPYTEYNGFEMFKGILKARIYILLNFGFWKQSFSSTVEAIFCKLKVICFFFDNKISKLFLIILTLPLWTLVFFIWLMLICFILVYYGLPMIFCVKHVLGCYLFAIFDRIHPKDTNNASTFKNCIVIIIKILVFMLFFVISSDVVFAFGLWFNYGLLWLWKVAGFTFVALIIYPKDVVGYAVLSTTMLFYLWKCIQNTCSAYTELFNQTIDIAIGVNEKINCPNVVFQEGIIKIDEVSTGCGLINKLCVNGKVYKTEEIQETLIIDKAERNTKIIFYKNGMIPGISAKMFFRIIDEIRPLRKELFHSFIKLTITFQFLYFTISTITHFERHYNLEAIAQVMATVSIGMLPLLAEMIGMISSAQQAMQLDIQKRKIAHIISEYLRADSIFHIEDNSGFDSVICSR